MDKYIDLLRNLVKNFKYSNEFDDIIKKILNKIFNNYYVILVYNKFILLLC